jgi:serine/threonine-protein kinase
MSVCPFCQAENEDGAANCFTCGRGLATLTKGTLLASRYEILSLVGRGGMGTVYQARDHVLDEIVALKVMRTDLNEAAARRFRSEIKLARKVTHPNVCRIHDYGEEGPFRYISMELIEGRDLKHSLQRHHLSGEEAFEAAIQLAEGLQAIHKVGIVHRDLKTPNIMRDREGTIRLMDFGIAKQFEAEGVGATATGQIVGTPEYMSPEQVRGERLDQRSDIYALGIVIFELFTGRVPFRGDTPMATLFKQIQDPVPFDEARAEGLPEALVPALDKALAKDRSDRFSSVQELGQALREARAAARDAPAPAAPIPSRLATAVDPAPVPTTPLPTPVPTSVQTEIKTTPIPSFPPPPPRPASEPARRPAARQNRNARALAVAAGTATVALTAAAAIVMWARPKAPGAGDAPPEPSTTVRAVEPPRPPEPTPRASPAVSEPTPAAVPTITSPLIAQPTASAPTLSSPRTPRTPQARASPSPWPPSISPASPATGSSPPAAALAQEPGSLQLYVLPWAEVSIDGRTVGSTPLPKRPLTPGRHTLRLVNPRYEPLEREIQILPGETLRVQVNLEREATPRK